jgi:hypothetical protein
VRYSLLPISEEAVLRRSTRVTVHYEVNGAVKKLQVSGAELSELLATLQVRREDYMYINGSSGTVMYAPMVEFQFPNGTTRSYAMTGKNHLGNYLIDPAFHDKLCDIASRHEQQRVDKLANAPVVFAPPANDIGNGNQVVHRKRRTKS